MRAYPAKKLAMDQNVDDVFFEFDEWIWKGTVKTKRSVYNGEMVKFLNVKLPNDGYIYTDNSAYKEGQSDALKEFRELLQSIMPEGTTFTKWFYNFEWRKLEIHFTEARENQQKIIYHIGFDYGTPEYRSFNGISGFRTKQAEVNI